MDVDNRPNRVLFLRYSAVFKSRGIAVPAVNEIVDRFRDDMKGLSAEYGERRPTRRWTPYRMRRQTSRLW